MHVSTLNPCYNSYRVFQVIATRLRNALPAVAPATIRLLLDPVPGLHSYPLTVIFVCSRSRPPQVRVQKYTLKQLLQAGGHICWRPHIIAPDNITVEVVVGMPLSEAVRLILVDVCLFSSSSSSFDFCSLRHTT